MKKFKDKTAVSSQQMLWTDYYYIRTNLQIKDLIIDTSKFIYDFLNQNCHHFPFDYTMCTNEFNTAYKFWP